MAPLWRGASAVLRRHGEGWVTFWCSARVSGARAPVLDVALGGPLSLAAGRSSACASASCRRSWCSSCWGVACSFPGLQRRGPLHRAPVFRPRGDPGLHARGQGRTASLNGSAVAVRGPAVPAVTGADRVSSRQPAAVGGKVSQLGPSLDGCT